MQLKHNSFHRGWIVLIMGTLGVFGAIGLARFGYTTLLPLMQYELGLTNEQTGLIATYNLIGYLILSLLGGVLASHYGPKIVSSIGLMVVALGMLLTGFGQNFFIISLWRCITGLGSGAANIAIMGLWSSWFSENKRGMAAGIAVTGASFALILTGIFVPAIADIKGFEVWRGFWIAFSVITFIIGLLIYLLIKNKPDEINLKPIGNNDSNTYNNTNNNSNKSCWNDVYKSYNVWWLGLVYTCFGFSYIIYMTFFVKHLISEIGYSQTRAGTLFMILGWVSLSSGLIWGIISDKIGRKKTLIILYLIQTAAFGLFAFNISVFFILSAILYGITAWSIPAIMAALCGDTLGDKLAPAALGFITLFFGIGQAAGPFIAGKIADITGSFFYVFLLASFVALIGGILALMIKK